MGTKAQPVKHALLVVRIRGVVTFGHLAIALLSMKAARLRIAALGASGSQFGVSEADRRQPDRHTKCSPNDRANGSRSVM
jgi:hypothetical protein